MSLAALVPLYLSAGPPQQPAASTTDGVADAGHLELIAFVGVDLLAMDGAGIERERTVLVRAGRIAAVGPASEVEVPTGARVIPGAGLTLLPGLVDAHVHLPGDGSLGERGDTTWRVLSLMVAHGVTTARGLAGHSAHPKVRDRVRAGEVLGPALYVAAPALHQGNVKSQDAARAAVRAAHEQHFDLVKSHHITAPEVWRAIQDEARKLGIAVSGHVTNQVGLAAALEAGQQVEHLDGMPAALLPEGTEAGGWGQFPTPSALGLVERERIDGLARHVAEQGGWSTPTLALFERILDLETPVEELRALPAMRYVSPHALEFWGAQRAGMANAPGIAEVAAPFVALRRELVAALDRAGAPLLAGSDSPQAFLMCGPALIDELEALVRAGLTPLAALESATAAPARYLASLPRAGSAHGDPADFGRVLAGLRADLLLVGGDPSQDIGALRDVRGVLVRGRWLDRAALDALLGDVADVVAGRPLRSGSSSAVELPD